MSHWGVRKRNRTGGGVPQRIRGWRDVRHGRSLNEPSPVTAESSCRDPYRPARRPVRSFRFRLPHPGIKPGVRVCRRLGCLRARDGGEHDDNLTNPVVIFEVLSPSTEKYDRGLKFQHYRTLDSPRDYILVNQEQVRIEQFTPRPDGDRKSTRLNSSHLG